MAAHESATRKLIEALGVDKVRTDRDARYGASMDNMRYSRMPSARILPAHEEDIEQVLLLANQHGVPVTARGAGSSTTGAASPSLDGWVIDLAHWKKAHIDPVARMAFAQPGVVLLDLDGLAAEEGLMYAVDPGSQAHATVGGTIATNAGGMRAAKYGVTRDQVIALEGFLPTGEFVRWGANLKKFSAGYNMRDLWVGSEGTLGIITGAVLKLIPKPAVRATCMAVFPSSGAALTSSHNLLLAGLTPSAIEFLDAETVGCTFSFWRRKDPASLDQLPLCLRKWCYSPQPPALLLIEVDGSREGVEAQIKEVEAEVARCTGDWTSSMEPETTELLWKIRRSCSQAMFELAPRKLNEDVVVPFDSQLLLLDFTAHLQETFGLPTPTFGHAADGNFHVHIMYDDGIPETVEKARKALQQLMEHVVEVGGAISGEHGIGLAKSAFFRLQHSPAETRAMQAIKDALDPNGILNPGKLWEPTEPWKFPRESVQLPWDH